MPSPSSWSDSPSTAARARISSTGMCCGPAVPISGASTRSGASRVSGADQGGVVHCLEAPLPEMHEGGVLRLDGGPAMGVDAQLREGDHSSPGVQHWRHEAPRMGPATDPDRRSHPFTEDLRELVAQRPIAPRVNAQPRQRQPAKQAGPVGMVEQACSAEPSRGFAEKTAASTRGSPARATGANPASAAPRSPRHRAGAAGRPASARGPRRARPARRRRTASHAAVSACSRSRWRAVVHV